MERTINWLLRLASWLTVEASGFWAFAAPLVLGFALILWLKSENSVKCAGILLQATGTAFFIYNFYSLAVVYKLKNPIGQMAEWFYNSPIWGRPKVNDVTGNLDVTLGDITLSASGSSATSELPAEERISILETRLTSLHSKLVRLENENVSAHESIENTVSTETAHRKDAINDIHEKIKDSQTGGIVLSVIGALLLLLGSIVSTFPEEVIRAIPTWNR